MAFRRKKERSDKTVGLCSVCEQYITNGHYKFKKVTGKPQIVCEWCEKKLNL